MPFFVSVQVVDVFVEHLRRASVAFRARVIYCFMPEHLHTITIGGEPESDALRFMQMFKQTTGWWLKNNHPEVEWQKSFYDRIARSIYEEAHLTRYLVNNPVRRGLVEAWKDYPFTGAIGLDLNRFLEELMPS